jgi:nitroreductase
MSKLSSTKRRVRRALSTMGPVAFYRTVDRAFDQEMRVVGAGLARYHAVAESSGSRYHLVRNVHMIEKGLTMRPRRDTFATGYIEETVDLWHRVTSAGLIEAEEKTWANDVLVEYFAATSTSEASPVRRAAARAAEVGLLLPAGAVAVPAGGSGPHHPAAPTDLVHIDDLVKLAQGRRSVRWFLGEKVPRSMVDAAARVARESPTACNRQPYRFLVVDDKSVVDVAAIPMGTRGYEDQIPGIIVVIGDWSAYFDERDRHLPYIDGSLAAMSLVLGLEAQGISTCCINWPDIPARERAMRSLLRLADHERVLMLIAYGYADPTGTVPFSGKRDLDAVRQYATSEPGQPATSDARGDIR